MPRNLSSRTGDLVHNHQITSPTIRSYGNHLRTRNPFARGQSVRSSSIATRTVPLTSHPQKRSLDDTSSEIEQIRKRFGAPSFAIGIIHKGERAFKGFGFANKETGRRPDAETIYGIGSCTKAFTATVLSRLADDGKLDLDQPVSARLPELRTVHSPDVAEKMTVRDMLSHCAGLSQLIYSIVGKNGSVYARHEDIVHIFNHLPKVAEFKSEWQYNNWLFALAGVLICQETGQSFGTVVKREIFAKLGMTRSYFTYPPDGNFAVPYRVLDNAPSIPTALPALGDGDAFDSSGSCRSCVRDMLTWAEALLDARKTESSQGQRASIPQELSRAMRTIQLPHFPLGDDIEQQYGLGLYSYKLPTSAINTVTNGDTNTVSYVLGKDSRARAMVGHTGDYGGFLAVYWAFPDDDAAIVVLTNTFETNGDPTNIVAQLLAQELFALQPYVDMVSVAENIVYRAKARWTEVVEDLTSDRRKRTRPRDIHSYAGSYTNPGLAMILKFVVPPGREADQSVLSMSINGSEEQDFPLHHYHLHSWTFLPNTRNDCIARGFDVFVHCAQSFVLNFSSLADGVFQSVSWMLDPDSSIEESIFTREASATEAGVQD